MLTVEQVRNKVSVKLNKYVKKYTNASTVALKLMLVCCELLYKSLFNKKIKGNRNKNKTLHIAIRGDGGLGDLLVYSIWIKEFLKLIKSDYKLDIYPSRNISISLACFKNCGFVDNVYSINDFDEQSNKYDMVLGIRRFPHVIYYNKEKVNALSGNLNDIINEYVKFYDNNRKFFESGPELDTLIDLFSICREEKRYQQPDINNLLGINKETKCYLPLDRKALTFYEQNLQNCKYITVARSVGGGYSINDNVRLWSLENFKSLMLKIKQEYPDIKIVQLGIKHDELIEGVDINLLGKTSLEELKVILKKSMLHIDGECGMVHLKHFLHGTSCVLFGQTSIDYLGYENNINIKSDGCKHWCEWIVNDWQYHCIRGFKNPPCMTEIKVDDVFAKINEYLAGYKNKTNKSIACHSDVDITEFLQGVENKKIVFYGKDYLEYATTLSNNSTVVIYDEKLNNSDIAYANSKNILLEYADIYNIPEADETCDYFILPSDKMDSQFVKEEIERILRYDGIILSDKN